MLNAVESCLMPVIGEYPLLRLSDRIDWNDLRMLLTLADTLKVQTTAEVLDIDPTTVTRRIKRLEKHSQVKLVERIRGGVVLTAECHELIKSARIMDRALDDVACQVDTDAKMQISGTVRLSMTDFMVCLLAEDFARLQKRYPKLHLDFRESYFKHSLESKEADIAIRFANSPNEGLVGTRHNIACSIWGHASFKNQTDCWPWLSMNTAHNIIDRWVDENDPGGAVVFRCSSIISKSKFVQQGLGVAALPDVWVKSQAELSDLVKIRDGFDTETWILTSEELRNVPKIKTCMSLIKNSLNALTR